jgi:hypothetical protein
MGRPFSSATETALNPSDDAPSKRTVGSGKLCPCPPSHDHIQHITAQSRQALFFYLKGALQESPNLEIEDDRRKVIGFIESLGFNPTLTQSLNEAEKNYRANATGFELKDCMSHLRSFVEQLHIDACEPVADSIGEPKPPKKWGKAIAFLRTNGILSVQEEMFITSLYTLISDEGIHPLIAEREYVRIRRNMVVEYGLMFLTVLDKKGLKVRVVSLDGRQDPAPRSTR